MYGTGFSGTNYVDLLRDPAASAPSKAGIKAHLRAPSFCSGLRIFFFSVEDEIWH